MLIYLKDNLKWVLEVPFCAVLMAAIMMLNHNPTWEILYGLCIVLVVFLIFLGCDMYGQWKRCKKLQEFSYSVQFSIDGLEQIDKTFLEKAYYELLCNLFEADRRQQNEVENRQKDMREYYAMWVHQIKTPIAALRLLLQEKSGQNEMREELEELFRIEQYVEMALQYMRLDSESTDFVIRKVNLDGVIREAVHKYARQFIHKKINLDFNPVETQVVTDEKWAQFVVEQILSNAIKYTVKGKISISIEQDDTQEKPVSYLVIEDTGIGIRAEDLPRICEKGYTGYNGHADKHSTGIGLYLCNRILKKLGHSLTITSTEGVGTKVKIGF